MLASVHKREYSPVAVLPGMLSHSNSSTVLTELAALMATCQTNKYLTAKQVRLLAFLKPLEHYM